MAQFDVYLNPNTATKSTYPYLLDIQSELISQLSTRVVIPLTTLQNFQGQSMKTLTPIIQHNDEKYVLLTPQLSSVSSKLLKKPIGTLEHYRDEIIASLDFLITGI